MADRNSLTRATESTDSPTPGYLYNDIAKSVSSSPTACSETATYLIRRLSTKQNHNIKYKCLKVIQMVAVNPMTRGQFKRAISADVGAIGSIKECLTFRGVADPVHGDRQYEKVRTQAKETLDAIYSDVPTSSGMGGGGGGGMQGMGSGSYGGQGGGGGYGNPHQGGGGGGMSHQNTQSMGGGGGVGMNGGKRMEGIGNPMFKDARSDDQQAIGDMTVGDMVSAAKTGFAGMIRDPLARSAAGGGNSSDRHRIGSWNNPPGQSQLAHATNGQWTMASNRGPNAITNNNSESYNRDAYQRTSQPSSTPYPSTSSNAYPPTGVGGSWASSTPQSQSRSLPSSGNSVVINGPTGPAASDGTYERNLIRELCPPGGMRAEPPEEKLQSFRQAIPSLNPDLVCPALLDALEDGQPWIIRAKALCVMESSILVAEQGGGNNPYADFFHACREEIEPLATHSRSAVREPAKRVLKALGLEVAVFSQAPKVAQGKVGVSPVVHAPVAPPPNLLDFEEEMGAVPPLPSLPPPVAPPVPPPAAPPTAASGNNSLFGGMNVKAGDVTNTMPVMPPQASPPVPPPPQNIEPDLFAPSLTPTTTPAPGLFGNVTVVGPTTTPITDPTTADGKENIEQLPEPASPTRKEGSGFSFIAKTTSAPSSPDKATFDPLLSNPAARNLDPNTMMSMQQMQQQGGLGAISPAQMNPQMAAAYQQQILMMQMQMQQMQMGGQAQQFMMMQQQQQSSGSLGGGGKGGSSINIMPGGNKIMGATTGSGVATSFAFMDDPTKVKRDTSNKKFDFVMDAMKDAK